MSHVAEMSYPDFVAFIQQENTPPLGDATVGAWQEMGAIDSGSHILDWACSTGYSSRTLVAATGCSAEGIDISAPAIEVANRFVSRDGIAHRARYRVGDGLALPFADGTFSHVVAGACLGFVDDQARALREIARVLRPGGLLCVSTFYYPETPPASILDRVQASLGFRPNPAWSRQFWDDQFDACFDLDSERGAELTVYPVAEIREWVAHFVANQCETTRDAPDELRVAVFRRLLTDRLAFNEHRRYQALAIQAWRARN
jgi:SAM-dependent methyltransferase